MYIAAIALLSLLVFVGVKSHEYLIDAFNPVTTNILGLGLCYPILYTRKHENG